MWNSRRLIYWCVSIGVVFISLNCISKSQKSLDRFKKRNALKTYTPILILIISFWVKLCLSSRFQDHFLDRSTISLCVIARTCFRIIINSQTDKNWTLESPKLCLLPPVSLLHSTLRLDVTQIDCYTVLTCWLLAPCINHVAALLALCERIYTTDQCGGFPSQEGPI